MSKFVAFFLSLGLFTAPLAQAQSTIDKRDEAYQQLLIEAGYSAFHALKTLNQICVRRTIESKSTLMFTPAATSLLLGAYFGKMDQLKAVRTYVDSVMASDMHSLNKLDEVSKAGLKSSQSIKLNKGRFPRFLSRAGIVVLLGWAAERAYQFKTGNDLLSMPTLHEFVLWASAKFSTATDTKSLAAYYTTKSGFIEFLRLEDEASVKALMNESPLLVAGTIALMQIVNATDCRSLEFVAPESLDEKSKELITTRPAKKPKGEAL